MNNNTRLGSNDIREITVGRRQGLNPGLLGDVPCGLLIDAYVDRRCAIDPGSCVACDGSGPCRVAAEFPSEVCRILSLDITHNDRLGHDDKGSERVAVT